MHFQGIPASPGIAVGPLFLYMPDHAPIRRDPFTSASPDAEWHLVEVAIAHARGQIIDLRETVTQRTSVEEAAIFDAHLLVLEDEELLNGMRDLITQQRLNAEAAVWDAMAVYREQLLAIDDDYLRARAADLEDIARRVIACLRGEGQSTLTQIAQPSVIVARDLLPSDTAGLNPAMTLAIVTELGGPTAHTAILARQMGIPAVVGATGIVAAAAQAINAAPVTLALDGASGVVEVNPTTDVIVGYLAQRDARHAQRAHFEADARQPAIMSDGRPIEIGANVGQLRELPDVAQQGAQGIGLFRTEFLFLDRTSPPTEDEQFAAYREAAHHVAGGTVIIRTLDIGGDKVVPYLPLDHEDNPFLGVRGLRLCLTPAFQPLFKTQLRAILRAASGGARLKVMFPMVNHSGEMHAARVLLREAAAELDGQGIAASAVLEHLPVGAMIETPAAAFVADQLADDCDFFSIGTNDLTQYVLAIDRMNPTMAGHYTSFSPAVLRAIYHAVSMAHSRGRHVGMCGEMAGDPRAIPLLLGIGLDELSMVPPAIAEAKHVIRRCTQAGVSDLSRRAFALTSAEAVTALLEDHLRSIMAS